MAGTVKAIPEGFHSVTPYLSISGAAQAIEFYKKAFGAIELVRMPAPDNKVGHAEIKIGDSIIMMADEVPGMGNRSPQTLGGSPVGMLLYVEDADKVFHQAVAAGAKAERPLKDEFYGDRAGSVRDPFGHEWHIHTHIEDVTPEEMQKRMAAMAPA